MRARLKRAAFVIVFLMATLVLGRVSAEAYVETFDSGSAGWKTWFMPSFTGVDATFHASGGNPGGYISGYVNGTERLYAFDASASPFGDLTGQTLRVDYKIGGTVTSPTPADVRFYFGTTIGGNKYYVSNNTFSWDPNANTDWTTHTVSVLPANFIEWPNQNTGSQTFAQVAAAPEWIGLVLTDSVFTNNDNLGFQSTAGATISVDNFGAVPIPGAVWLLGSGLMGCAGVRRLFRL